MSKSIAMVSGLGWLALGLFGSPVYGQDLRAEVRVNTGPVIGRVVIDNHRSHDRDRVIVHREVRRVHLIEDYRDKVQRSHSRHLERHRVLYFDYRSGRYGFERRPGFQRVVVCEHGDKYYRLDNRYLPDGDPRHGRGYRSRSYDRY